MNETVEDLSSSESEEVIPRMTDEELDSYILNNQTAFLQDNDDFITQSNIKN